MNNQQHGNDVPTIGYTKALRAFDASLSMNKPSDDQLTTAQYFTSALAEMCNNNELIMPAIQVIGEDDGLKFHSISELAVVDAEQEFGIDLDDKSKITPEMVTRLDEVINSPINHDVTLYDGESLISYVNIINNVELIERLLSSTIAGTASMIAYNDDIPKTMLTTLLGVVKENLSLNGLLDVNLYHKNVGDDIHVFLSKYTLNNNIRPYVIHSAKDIIQLANRLIRFNTLPSLINSEEKIKTSKDTIKKFSLDFYRNWHNRIFEKLSYDLISLNPYFMDNYLENTGSTSKRVMTNGGKPVMMTPELHLKYFNAGQDLVCEERIDSYVPTPSGPMFSIGTYIKSDQLENTLDAGFEGAKDVDVMPITVLAQYYDENQKPMINRNNTPEDIAKIPDDIALDDKNLMITLMVRNDSEEIFTVIQAPPFIDRY